MEEQLKEIKQLLIAVLEAQRAMYAEFTGFKTEMTEFKTEMTEFKAEMTEFRGETTGRLASIDDKLDHLVEKWVETDREIFKLKREKSQP